MLFVLFASFASATDYITFIEAEKDEITIDEIAKFKLYTQNFQEEEDIISVYFEDPAWNVYSTPLYHYFSGIQIKPNSTEETILFIQPSKSMGIGKYNIKMETTSKNTNTKVTKSFPIRIKPTSQGRLEYAPTVEITTTIPETIDPRKETSLKIHLKNKNPLYIENLTISIEGELIDEYRITNLPGLVEKTEEFTIKLDPLLQPKTDALKITIMRNDNILRVIQKNIQTIEYKEVTKDLKEEKSFLKTIQTITVTNNGNTKNTEQIKLPTSLSSKIFQSSTPEGAIEKDLTGEYHTWQVNLLPQDSTQIVITTSYRSLIILTIIIFLIILSYFAFRSQIVVKKIGTTVAMKDEGQSEVKILLHVKNRSHSFVQNLKIIDRIPHLADVDAEETLGTLAPTKILKHEKKGTLIKWNIETIEAQEERILSYKMVARLSILGHFTLPSTIVKYQTAKGKDRITSSDKTTV